MAEPICPPAGRRLLIGIIGRVRGLRGDLKIAPQTWDITRFEELEGVWVDKPDEPPRYMTFKRMRIEAGSVFIRFNEAPLRDLAAPLVGAELFIDTAQRLELLDDMYYVDDVIGCSVVDEEQGEIGTLTGVIDQAAQDIWQVEGEQGEVLIPVVREFIREMDLEAKRIRVALPPGLL